MECLRGSPTAKSRVELASSGRFRVSLVLWSQSQDQEITMKAGVHSMTEACSEASPTVQLVQIEVSPTHPLLLLKRALPWDTLTEVMTRHWRQHGKNVDGGPGLPWDVSLYVPLVVLMLIKAFDSRQMEAYVAENVVARVFSGDAACARAADGDARGDQATDGSDCALDFDGQGGGEQNRACGDSPSPRHRAEQGGQEDGVWLGLSDQPPGRRLCVGGADRC